MLRFVSRRSEHFFTNDIGRVLKIPPAYKAGGIVTRGYFLRGTYRVIIPWRSSGVSD